MFVDFFFFFGIIRTLYDRERLKWVGHVSRRNCLLHDLIEGKLQTYGTRRAGRRKIQILDELLEKRKYWELKGEAEDRNKWREHFSIRAKPKTCFRAEYQLLIF